MEDPSSTSLSDFNIKEEYYRDEIEEDEHWRCPLNEIKVNYNKHIIYLPEASSDKFIVEYEDVKTEDASGDPLNAELETKEKSTLNNSLNYDFSNLHRNRYNNVNGDIKTETNKLHNEIDVDNEIKVAEESPDYSCTSWGLAETKTDSIQRRAKKDVQTKFKSELPTHGEVQIQKQLKLEEPPDCQLGLTGKNIICEVRSVRRTQKHIVKDKSEKSVRQTGLKLHECNVCCKKFKRQKDLKRHMLIHSDLKPHECNICHMKFKLPANLKRHMSVHSEVKDHECNVCHKKFKWFGCLKIHLLTHSEIKPYECNICHKKFRNTCNLNAHITTHSNAQPYKCNSCSKKFKHSKSLNKHMLTHSE